MTCKWLKGNGTSLCLLLLSLIQWELLEPPSSDIGPSQTNQKSVKNVTKEPGSVLLNISLLTIMSMYLSACACKAGIYQSKWPSMLMLDIVTAIFIESYCWVFIHYTLQFGRLSVILLIKCWTRKISNSLNAAVEAAGWPKENPVLVDCDAGVVCPKKLVVPCCFPLRFAA